MLTAISCGFTHSHQNSSQIRDLRFSRWPNISNMIKQLQNLFRDDQPVKGDPEVKSWKSGCKTHAA